MQPLPASSLSYLGCYGLPKLVLDHTWRCFEFSGPPLKTGYTEDAAGRASNSLTPSATRFTLAAALELGCRNAMPEHLHPLYEEPLAIAVRHLVTQVCDGDAQAWASRPETTAEEVSERLQAAWVQAGRLDVHPRNAWITARRIFRRMEDLLKDGWMPGCLDARPPDDGRRTTPQCFRDACEEVRQKLTDDALYASALWGAYAVLEDASGTPDLGSLGRDTPFTLMNSLETAALAGAQAAAHAGAFPRHPHAEDPS